MEPAAQLVAHPLTPCGWVRSIEAQISMDDPGGLRVSYRLAGDLSKFRLPRERTPARADGLWRHTCFEMFLRVPGEAAYCEFNFSPSGEWAAYVFDDYRAGMRPLGDGAGAVLVSTASEKGALTLDAVVPSDWLPQRDGLTLLLAAVTAVIEDEVGALSYWALKHPAGPPDFHASAGFSLKLGQLRPGSTPSIAGCRP